MSKKLKGMLFTENIDKIEDGTKTQTRRVAKQYRGESDIISDPLSPTGFSNMHGYPIKPTYKVGDIIYVKEAYAEYIDEKICYYYKADGWERNRWRNPMYMPRKAARLFLKVLDVKCERLQDISEADAIKEGIERSKDGPLFWHILDNSYPAWFNYNTHKEAFAYLWDKINGKKNKSAYKWENNPFVFVYEFERIAEPVGTGGEVE